MHTTSVLLLVFQSGSVARIEGTSMHMGHIMFGVSVSRTTRSKSYRHTCVVYSKDL